MNETEELAFIHTKLIIYLKHLCDDLECGYDFLPWNYHTVNYVYIKKNEFMNTFLEYVEDSLGKKPINRIKDIITILCDFNIEIDDDGLFKIPKPIINNLFFEHFKIT